MERPSSSAIFASRILANEWKNCPPDLLDMVRENKCSLRDMSSDSSQNRSSAVSSPEWCVVVTLQTTINSAGVVSSSLDKIKIFFQTPVVAESDEE